MFISTHAQMRCAQRNVSPDEINFILEHGKRCHRAGAVFYVMLAKDLPKDLRADDRYRRLNGVTVVLSKCGQVVKTVYRNPEAMKKVRRKMKYTAKPNPLWQ